MADSTTPTTKTRQQLREKFVANAIPTEQDFTDLINANLNLADDGKMLRLTDPSLSVVRQPGDDTVLRFYGEPSGKTSAWQMRLIGTEKPGLGFSNQPNTTALFLDGPTGNVGIGKINPSARLHVAGGLRVDADLTVQGGLSTGTGNVGIGANSPAQKLMVEGPWNVGKDLANNLSNAGQLAIKGPSVQLDFIDADPNQADWAIHVNEGKLLFIRSPWDDKNLVLDSSGNVGIGTATPAQKLTVEGPWGPNVPKDSANNLSNAGQLAIKGTIAQLDFVDSDPNQTDWAIHVNEGKLSFVRSPDIKDLVIDDKGNVGIGTGTPAAKLHVAGALRVDGFIRATKYRTMVLGYEFESDGRIMTPCQEGVYEKKIFAYAGVNQILTIGDNIAYIFVKLWGAGGGASFGIYEWRHGAAGGGGGHTRGLFPVAPGDTLIVVVGRGGTATNGTTQSYGGGGTNGSDSNKCYSGHGGGYCGIFRNSVSQQNALAIAGGGGGGGSSREGPGNVGGAGGGHAGEPGQSPYKNLIDTNRYLLGGGGGTQWGGGSASQYIERSAGPQQPATPGGSLQGGKGAQYDFGGGGGGGYFGGGGGAYSENNTMAGGGGGSGFILSSFPLSGTFTGHLREPAFSEDPDIKSYPPAGFTYPSGANPQGTIGFGYGGEVRAYIDPTASPGSQSGGHALAVIYLLKKIT